MTDDEDFIPALAKQIEGLLTPMESGGVWVESDKLIAHVLVTARARVVKAQALNVITGQRGRWQVVLNTATNSVAALQTVHDKIAQSFDLYRDLFAGSLVGVATDVRLNRVVVQLSGDLTSGTALVRRYFSAEIVHVERGESPTVAVNKRGPDGKWIAPVDPELQKLLDSPAPPASRAAPPPIARTNSPSTDGRTIDPTAIAAVDPGRFDFCGNRTYCGPTRGGTWVAEVVNGQYTFQCTQTITGFARNTTYASATAGHCFQRGITDPNRYIAVGVTDDGLGGANAVYQLGDTDRISYGQGADVEDIVWSSYWNASYAWTPNMCVFYDAGTNCILMQRYLTNGELFVGKTIFKSGITTGNTQGTILRLDWSGYYSDNVFMNGLIESQMCVIYGDSGAPVYDQSGTTSRLVGIVSALAGLFNGQCGSKSRSYIVKMANQVASINFVPRR